MKLKWLTILIITATLIGSAVYTHLYILKQERVKYYNKGVSEVKEHVFRDTLYVTKYKEKIVTKTDTVLSVVSQKFDNDSLITIKQKTKDIFINIKIDLKQKSYNAIILSYRHPEIVYKILPNTQPIERELESKRSIWKTTLKYAAVGTGITLVYNQIKKLDN